MNKIRNNLIIIKSFLRKNWFIFFTITTYLFFTVYYMGLGTTVLDCGSALNGLGDNTAGPIWKAANAGELPIGGFSKVTNYPSGESLNSPIDTVVAGQSILLWATAKIAGPVCGYNIANVLGYMSAALVMFTFVYYLTKGRRWIALLAGYAVAFTPFFQAKIGGHPSYGFQALLIGILWTFFSLVATRKKSRAVLLALLIATCFYFDPYFSLLAFTILLPLGFVWLSIGLVNARKEKSKKLLLISQVKILALSLALLTVLVAPLLYVITTQSSQINSAVAGTRDNIFMEARVYSNMPSEYLLPFRDSPFFALLGRYEQQVHQSLFIFSNSNLSEDSVGISLVILFVIFLFIIIITWEKLQHKRLGISKLVKYDARLVVYGSLAVAATAVIVALPPFHIFGLPMPSYILLEITNTWRVLSREYVVVNIATVILFVMALVYFSHTLPLRRISRAIIYIFLFLLVFFQYQTYRPFQGLESSNFNYNNAPKGYSWLKDQEDIKAIAEYPIEKAAEANSHGYYMSMQIIHKKALLNSVISNSPDDTIRSSIKNISDPQTIPVLHSLGINAIVIHGVDLSEVEKIPHLEVVYKGTHGLDAGLPGSYAITKDMFVVARILDSAPFPSNSIQFPNNLPRNSSIQTSALNWQYEIPTGTEIALRRLPENNLLRKSSGSNVGEICFMSRMAAPGDSGQLILKDGRRVVDTIALDDQYKDVRISANIKNTIKLVSNNGHNMRITNVGCQE